MTLYARSTLQLTAAALGVTLGTLLRVGATITRRLT